MNKFLQKIQENYLPKQCSTGLNTSEARLQSAEIFDAFSPQDYQHFKAQLHTLLKQLT